MRLDFFADIICNCPIIFRLIKLFKASTILPRKSCEFFESASTLTRLFYKTKSANLTSYAFNCTGDEATSCGQHLLVTTHKTWREYWPTIMMKPLRTTAANLWRAYFIGGSWFTERLWGLNKSIDDNVIVPLCFRTDRPPSKYNIPVKMRRIRTRVQVIICLWFSLFKLFIFLYLPIRAVP